MNNLAGLTRRNAGISISIMVIASIISITIWWLKARGLSGKISDVVRRLQDDADQVTEASGNISNSSRDLAEGSSRQAAGLEESSASLEEMASMTRQNADNAGQADKLMFEAKKMVGESMQAMERMTGEINNIRESANRTAKIIKTIVDGHAKIIGRNSDPEGKRKMRNIPVAAARTSVWHTGRPEVHMKQHSFDDSKKKNKAALPVGPEEIIPLDENEFKDF